MNSLLKLERTRRGWSRPSIEKETGIPQRSLENWEDGDVFPREDNIRALCRLYGKTREELGFGKSRDIIGSQKRTVYAPQEEEDPMSDLIRRHLFSNLGSRLFSLVDTWPRRNYRYEELQSEINKAIFDHHVLVQEDSTSEMSRREALKSLALAPVQLVGGIAIIQTAGKQKADTEALLKRCAAGITACWYLRRGRDLEFVNDLMSTYISLLTPLVNSHLEVHRKASVELLSQTERLRGSITEHLKNSDQARVFYDEAIRYALMAESITEQIIAYRMMAFSYWRQGPSGYEQALSHAQKAYGLMRKDTPKIIRSFTASGLSLCRAVNGQTDDAKISLGEALDLFDSTISMPSMYYTESNLIAISANVHHHCGLWQESTNQWEKSIAASDISVDGSIQARINYAKTEVSRDDQNRNMALCVKLLNEAITGAKELGSKHYQQEARKCYDLLRAAWPREQAIKTLGRDHFGIVK